MFRGIISNAQWRYRIAGAVLGIGFMSALAAQATPQPAPPGDPLAHFQSYDETSERRLDHGQWAAILSVIFQENTTSGEPQLEYGRLHARGRDMLASYLRVLQKIDVTALNRQEQLAYWLNLYNAASLNFVYDELIRQRSAAGQGAGKNPWAGKRLRVKTFYMGKKTPWVGKTLQVEGIRLSLNDIEHRILYAFWDPPIVMYGLSCPAKGCPALGQTPLKGSTVITQLEQAARKFIASDEGVRIDRGRLKTSELYGIHAQMFGGMSGVLSHIRKYADTERQVALDGVEGIYGEQFSWKLAGKEPPKKWTTPLNFISRGAGRL